MLFYLVSLLQLPARTLLIRPRTLDRVRYGKRFTLNKRLKDILHEVQRDAAPITGPLLGDDVHLPTRDPVLSKVN